MGELLRPGGGAGRRGQELPADREGRREFQVHGAARSKGPEVHCTRLGVNMEEAKWQEPSELETREEEGR